MSNYYVVQMIFDCGRIDTQILKEGDALARGYRDGYYEEHLTFDIFVDGFTTHEAAEKFKVETVGA